MIATSVAGRGLDVPDIVCVINFSCPNHLEDYVHRVGRTARAQSSGVAITLVNKQDQGKFKRIEELIEMEILKLPTPSDIGESPEYNPFEKKKRNFKSFKKKNVHKKNINHRIKEE